MPVFWGVFFKAPIDLSLEKDITNNLQGLLSWRKVSLKQAIKIWVFPKNVGTPKSSILIGCSMIFTIHFGVPPFWETPIYKNQSRVSFPHLCTRLPGLDRCGFHAGSLCGCGGASGSFWATNWEQVWSWGYLKPPRNWERFRSNFDVAHVMRTLQKTGGSCGWCLAQGIGFDKSAPKRGQVVLKRAGKIADTSRGLAAKKVGLQKVTPELQPGKCSGAFFLFFCTTQLGWWFQTCFIFTPTWGNDPIWQGFFFRWAGSTTN